MGKHSRFWQAGGSAGELDVDYLVGIEVLIGEYGSGTAIFENILVSSCWEERFACWCFKTAG